MDPEAEEAKADVLQEVRKRLREEKRRNRLFPYKNTENVWWNSEAPEQKIQKEIEEKIDKFLEEETGKRPTRLTTTTEKLFGKQRKEWWED